MPASYETQIPNVITGSAQSTATQEAQPVAPKVNGDDDDDDDDKNILPQNLDANKFENIANRDDFDFNTKKLHEILCYIVNGNPITDIFTIEKHDGVE